MKRLRAAALLGLVWCLALETAASEPAVLEIEEILGRETLGPPTLAPDGRLAVFTIGAKEAWDDQRKTSLWLVQIDDGRRLQLTRPSGSDWGPRWSPDGSLIAFLSSRADPPQVFVISPNGGEARRATDAAEGVAEFAWIDAETLVYVSPEPRDPAVVARETDAGGGFEVGARDTTSGLWRQSLAEPGAAVRITDGGFYIDAVAAAPDGGAFALVTAPSSDPYVVLTEGELRLIDGEGVTLRAERPGRALEDPEFAPDGRHFSVVASTVGFSLRDGLFVFDRERPGGRNLSAALDPTILESGWIDDETLSFTTLRGSVSEVVAVSLDGAPARTLLGPGLVLLGHSGPGPDGRLVFVASRGREPEALMVHRAGDPADRTVRLVELNPWLGNLRLAATEIIRYPSFDGVEIEAVLTLPVAPNPAEDAPLLVLPHGGPDGMSLDDFSFLPQLFAAAGLMVLEPNFRGSIGGGRELYTANRGRIGDVDYQDIMAGVDFLVASGRADPARLAVGGWSFGGTMTNWIIGHTRRFRAAVSVAGVSDYLSRYGTSDVNHGEIARWEFGRVLTEDQAFFVRSSPITHLAGCTTPTLLMHGERDRRVPVGQSLEMARALEELGVESTLVLYPDAGHGIDDPRQFRDVVQRWLAWYRSHLGPGDGGSVAPASL